MDNFFKDCSTFIYGCILDDQVFVNLPNFGIGQVIWAGDASILYFSKGLDAFAENM